MSEVHYRPTRTLMTASSTPLPFFLHAPHCTTCNFTNTTYSLSPSHIVLFLPQILVCLVFECWLLLMVRLQLNCHLYKTFLTTLSETAHHSHNVFSKVSIWLWKVLALLYCHCSLVICLLSQIASVLTTGTKSILLILLCFALRIVSGT